MPFTLIMLPPLSDLAKDYADQLASDLPDVTVLVPSTDSEMLEALETADAAFGDLPAPLVARAAKLRWLQCPQAGPPPGYYSAELVRHPVMVTNMRGTYTEEVATHAVMLLLALARRLPIYAARQQRHEWRKDLDPAGYLFFSEATVLIVGAGAVGAEISRLLAPFGCSIIATDARIVDPPPFIHELYSPDDLEELLPRADAVVITVPHTPATERLFVTERFRLMKHGALFVNVGRGPVVDLDDLVEALSQGTVRAAGLDVVPDEPLSVDHPLWEMEGVLITPHVASATAFAGSQRSRDAEYAVFVENARRFGRGDSLINVVDKTNWF